MKIVSLNTCGVTINLTGLTRRYKIMGDYFTASKCDVLLLQEVFTYYHLLQLKKNLSLFPYCIYQPSLVGPKGGLIIFSKTPLVNHQYTQYVKRKVPATSILERMNGKGVLQAKLRDHDISLVNTHLVAVLNHNWGKESTYYPELSAEVSQFHQVLKKLGKGFALIGGDFNIAKGSDLYQKLVSLKGLGYHFKTSSLTTRNHCIDYMFTYNRGSNYKIKSAKLIFNKFSVSDHKGLELVLEKT